MNNNILAKVKQMTAEHKSLQAELASDPRFARMKKIEKFFAFADEFGEEAAHVSAVTKMKALGRVVNGNGHAKVSKLDIGRATRAAEAAGNRPVDILRKVLGSAPLTTEQLTDAVVKRGAYISAKMPPKRAVGVALSALRKIGEAKETRKGWIARA